MDQAVFRCDFTPLNENEMFSIEGGDWIDVVIGVAGFAVGAAVGFAVAGPAGAAVGAKFGLSAANATAAGALIGCAVGAGADYLTQKVINAASGRK